MLEAAHERRGRAAAVPRLVVHLPQVRAAADPRERAADRRRSSPPTTRTRSRRSPGSCRCRRCAASTATRWISAMPTNLYGPGDNFDLHGSHVLPAMIRRFHEAKMTGGPGHAVGDGHAAARVPARRRPGRRLPVPAGALRRRRARQRRHRAPTSRSPSSPRLVAKVVGYDGPVVWDRSKPDGTPRKLLDVTKINELGLDGDHPPRRGHRQHLPVVPRAPRQGARRVAQDVGPETSRHPAREQLVATSGGGVVPRRGGNTSPGDRRTC